MASSLVPSQQFITNFAHALGGYAIVLSFTIFGHVWLGVLAAVGWATLKEFVWDKYVEKQPFKDNLLDWSYYMLGTAVAAIAVAAKEGVWRHLAG